MATGAKLLTDQPKPRQSRLHAKRSSRAMNAWWNRRLEDLENKSHTLPSKSPIHSRRNRSSRMLASRASSAPPAQNRAALNAGISAPLESEYGYITSQAHWRRNSPEEIKALEEIHPALRPSTAGGAGEADEENYMSIPIWEYPRPAPPIPNATPSSASQPSSSTTTKLKSQKPHITIASNAHEPRKRSKDGSIYRGRGKKNSSSDSAKRLTLLASADRLDQQGLMDWLAEERQFEAERYHSRRFEEAKKEISELRKLVKRCKRRVEAMTESLRTEDPQALACVDLDARFQVSSRILNAWQINVLKQNQRLEAEPSLVVRSRDSKTQTELLLEQVKIIRKAGLLRQEEPLTEAQLKAISTIAHLSEQVRTLQLILAEGSKKLKELEAEGVDGGAPLMGMSSPMEASEATAQNSGKTRALSNSNSVIEQAIHDLLAPSKAQWLEESAVMYDLPEQLNRLKIPSSARAVRHSSGSESGYASVLSQSDNGVDAAAAATSPVASNNNSSVNDVWSKTFLFPPTPDSASTVAEIPILERPALPDDASNKMRTHSIVAAAGEAQEDSSFDSTDEEEEEVEEGEEQEEEAEGEEEEEEEESESPFDTSHPVTAKEYQTPLTSYNNSPASSSPVFGPTSAPMKTEDEQVRSRQSSASSAASSNNSNTSTNSRGRRPSRFRYSYRRVAESRPVKANEPPQMVIGLDYLDTGLPGGGGGGDQQRRSSSVPPNTMLLPPQTSDAAATAATAHHHSPPGVPPKHPARLRHRSRPPLRSKHQPQHGTTPSSTLHLQNVRKVHSDSVGSVGSRSSRMFNHVVTKMNSFKTSPRFCL